MATKSRATKRKLPWYLRPFKWLLWFVIVSVVWVLIYAVVPPPVTVTMLTDGNGITKDWESLSNIDRNMVRAAIAAEDGKFCSHDGFDRDAIEDAIERNARGKRLRGGSTISQQTAKNVFLWQGSGWTRYVRKVPEIWFTFLIEKIWGKRRIMEVYLNVAETGLGTYGVEAGAQRYFKHGASRPDPDRGRAYRRDPALAQEARSDQPIGLHPALRQHDPRADRGRRARWAGCVYL